MKNKIKKGLKIVGFILMLTFANMLGRAAHQAYNNYKLNKTDIMIDREATVVMEYEGFKVVAKYVDLSLFNKDLTVQHKGNDVLGYTTVGTLDDIDVENKTMIINKNIVIQLTDEQLLELGTLERGTELRVFFTQAVYDSGYFIIQGEVMQGMNDLPVGEEFDMGDYTLRFEEKDCIIK